jgi:hypothetical protein
VSATGLRTTSAFGSCSGIIYPSLDAINGFMGPFESEADKQKACMSKTVFRFANGRAAENGKSVN